MSELSVYDSNAPKLVEHGYYPLVIGPCSKEPKVYVPSEKRFVLEAGWQHPRRNVTTSPQPDAGLGLRCGPQPGGGHVVAFDWDNDDAAIASMDVFQSTVSKAGARGFTSFYYSEEPIPSRDFRINDTMAMQVLSTGKQTVLPPSIHPDTKKPYAWDSNHTLYSMRPSDLPRLPGDYIERIEAILRPLGYEPEPEKPANANGKDHDDTGDNPFKKLNALALRNLVKWVPDLGLYALKRVRGYHASYVAVASWRPSTEGRPLEQRDRNLKISGSKGIVDFGNGDKFSPLDLVMRARNCSLSDAVGWLQERVQPDDGRVKIDFEAIISPGANSGGEEPKEEPKEEAREQAKGNDQRKKGRFRFTPFWELRPDVSEMPYLVDELIPAKGIVLLWGPPKCLKSFFVFGMMFHVGKGWEFHERAVQQGAVMYFAFEGSHGYRKRGEALRRHHELELDGTIDRTPITVVAGKADLVRDHALLIKEVRSEMAGVRPVAVVLDTLNKSLVGSESKDLDMAAYIRAAEAVRDAFDCVVIVVHHCGWDESRMRGHSSLRGAVDAEISITREGDVIVATVEEMRDGPDGVQIVGRTRLVEVGEDSRGRPLTSLVIEPHELDGTEGKKGDGKSGWPKALRVFHDAIIEATLTAGIDYQIEGGPKVKAVDLGTVRRAFYALYVVATETTSDAPDTGSAKRKAFARAVDSARQRSLIGARALENGKQLIWVVHPDPSYA